MTSTYIKTSAIVGDVYTSLSNVGKAQVSLYFSSVPISVDPLAAARLLRSLALSQLHNP